MHDPADGQPGVLLRGVDVQRLGKPIQNPKVLAVEGHPGGMGVGKVPEYVLAAAAARRRSWRWRAS